MKNKLRWVAIFILALLTSVVFFQLEMFPNCCSSPVMVGRKDKSFPIDTRSRVKEIKNFYIIYSSFLYICITNMSKDFYNTMLKRNDPLTCNKLETRISGKEMGDVKNCHKIFDQAIVTYLTRVENLFQVFLENTQQIILILILCSEFDPST